MPNRRSLAPANPRGRQRRGSAMRRSSQRESCGPWNSRRAQSSWRASHGPPPAGSAQEAAQPQAPASPMSRSRRRGRSQDRRIRLRALHARGALRRSRGAPPHRRRMARARTDRARRRPPRLRRWRGKRAAQSGRQRERRRRHPLRDALRQAKASRSPRCSSLRRSHPSLWMEPSESLKRQATNRHPRVVRTPRGTRARLQVFQAGLSFLHSRSFFFDANCKSTFGFQILYQRFVRSGEEFLYVL